MSGLMLEPEGAYPSGRKSPRCRVVLTSTGKPILPPLRNRRAARQFMDAISPLADWTAPESELVKLLDNREKWETICRAYRAAEGLPPVESLTPSNT